MFKISISFYLQLSTIDYLLLIKPESPQIYLDEIRKSRGYSSKRYNTLQTGYYNKPTEYQKASYDVYMIGLVKRKDEESDIDLNARLQSGISPNPCNMHGESLLHMICRRGDYKLLQILLNNGCCTQVADDYGRTPLHDACWAANPAFETVDLLLKNDLTLLHMTDCRGYLPLSYVRKDHWPVWIDFIDKMKDEYWPVIEQQQQTEDNTEGMSSTSTSTCFLNEAPSHRKKLISALVDEKPNTRPLQDPINALPLDLATLVASGKIEPDEAIQIRNQRLVASAVAENEKEDENDADSIDDDDSDDDDSDSDDDDSDDDDDSECSDMDILAEEVQVMLGTFGLRGLKSTSSMVGCH